MRGRHRRDDEIDPTAGDDQAPATIDLPTPEIDEPDANIYPDDTSTADYDFSGINEYSDLDYTTLEFTIGTNYRIDDKTSVYGAVNLMDMTDDQPYVYGDLTGALVTYSAGMTMKF